MEDIVEYVRWLKSCHQWQDTKKATVKVPPTVIVKVIEVLEALLKDNAKLQREVGDWRNSHRWENPERSCG